ncbi:MAG TPA: cytochrome c oxidase assembly protein [Woeseiaceae bacterium]|nr:cytochrome c oxidase assembly protein [Woeseiaceae bacterium]
MFEAFGHLAAQMLAHILLMNAVAPLLAIAAHAAAPRSWPTLLVPAAVVQVAALWAWHAPPVLEAAMHSDLLHLAMQASLLLVAFWFWWAIFSRREARWRAIVALLVTGKLFCLLGVLLVFAPRALYGLTGSALPDQQLAGLLMLIACPATYIVAGVVVAARWLGHIDSESRSPNARHAA